MLSKPPVRHPDQTEERYACDVACREAFRGRHQVRIRAFDVWRDCAQAGCTRQRACANDPYRCFMAFRRRTPHEEWAPMRDAFCDFLRRKLGGTEEADKSDPVPPSAPGRKARRPKP